MTNRSCRRPGPDRPGIERGVEHAGGIAQQALGVIECQRLHKRFRRQARPAAKQVMQFIRRDAGGIRHRIDVGLITSAPE